MPLRSPEEADARIGRTRLNLHTWQPDPERLAEILYGKPAAATR